ncbi:hypothetical protein [Thermocrinis sp.]|jgi:hypothetical protein|uniref:hypothetical protein n=1 Tax=Thermocrinis sp. TaxID=2024383 RepID=UPI003BFACCBE
MIIIPFTKNISIINLVPSPKYGYAILLYIIPLNKELSSITERQYEEKIVESVSAKIREFKPINFIGANIIKKPIRDVFIELAEFMNKEVGTFELPITIKNIMFKMIKNGNMFTIITKDKDGNVKDFTDRIVVDTSVIVNKINQLLANLDSDQSNNNMLAMSANQLDTIIKLLEKLNLTMEKINLTMEKINNNLEKILANKETIGNEIVKETSPIELVTNVEKDNQKDIAQDDISLLQDQLDLQNISVNDLLS